MLSPEGAADLNAQPVFLPFGLRFLEDKAYIFWNLSSDAGIKEGAELMAIDGTPIADVVSAILPLIPSDAGIRTARLRRLESPTTFGRLLALRFGRREARRVSFRKSPDEETRDVAIPGITTGDFSRHLSERYPAAAGSRPLYELSSKGSAAVLTIRGFVDDPDKARPRYPEFLKETFSSLEQKRTQRLIIDLRGAGGGLDEYARLLFAHVMDRPFFDYWALETKKDRYDLFRFTDESAAAAEELARPLRKNVAAGSTSSAIPTAASRCPGNRGSPGGWPSSSTGRASRRRGRQ